MTFTPAELAYLRDETIGRLATVGPAGDPQIRPVSVHLGPDETTIDIVGHALSATQKWRNVLREPQVAFIVDTVISVQPPRARGIEIRGIGTALPGAGSTDGGLSGDIIRITPRRIVAWGLDSPGTTARDVTDNEKEHTMTHKIDWDDAYRQQQTPAWNIGAPQPEYAALIARPGTVRDDVLDAGCGHAELSLALAARGHTVVGIDLSPTAVAAAAAAAAERGLSTATFAAADITSLTGYDGRFSTIFDSGLLHALPDELRENYLRAMHRAAAPGARFYILAFGAGAFADHEGPTPTQFTEEQLREEVSRLWVVDEVRPAPLFATIGQMPGFLLTAHRPQ